MPRGMPGGMDAWGMRGPGGMPGRIYIYKYYIKTLKKQPILFFKR
jgi:hypothetical protein